MQGDHASREPQHVAPEDEWKIEQGLDAHHLALLDQTTGEHQDGAATGTASSGASKSSKAEKPAEYNVENADVLFAEEKDGWHGYIEWEDYPEKREEAHKILITREFPHPPEFQLAPIPDTNPVLEGVRWKMWHKAIAGPLTNVPEESWEIVLTEKHPEMLHLLQFPYNGEPPKRLTAALPITPNPLHYVRNHGGIPIIEAPKWSLRLDGLVAKPMELSLSDLKNEDLFPHVEKVVTLQCSGTRRIEQITEYAGEGDEMINAPWAEGAIGTAHYVGISLKKVIKHCGGLIDGAKHLEMVGCDTYFKQNRVMNYAVSVPWSKVKANEVLLVWEMNGEPLPKIHGYPIRVLVLGYIGARSVKWLYRIRALKEPSRAPVQKAEYLHFTAQIGKHNQRYTEGIQIQEMPVSSAIMSPWNKQVVVHNGTLKLNGWAYSGGGRWPERVEVSPNGGFSWYACPRENMSKKYKFAWRTWHMEMPLDVEGWIEIVVRCWDNSLNTQPTEVRDTWNWGLHITQSAHRVKIYSVNKTREQTRKRLQDFEERGQSLIPLTRPTEFPTQSEEEYEELYEKYGPRDVED